MSAQNSDDYWQSRGACLSVDPDLFFPVSSNGLAILQLRQAKGVCAGCPVRTKCLEFALSAHPVHGVWGGTSERERNRIWTSRRVREPSARAG